MQRSVTSISQSTNGVRGAQVEAWTDFTRCSSENKQKEGGARGLGLWCQDLLLGVVWIVLTKDT